MFLFKIFGFVVGLSTMTMTEKDCYQYLKNMEERLLQEEKVIYSHLTEQEWKKTLTSNVQELRKWTLASASFGRYLHGLEIPSCVHQRELEELISFIKVHLEELETQRITNPFVLEESEDDFEMINQAEVIYQQSKEEWENCLRKLERQRLIKFERREETKKSHYQVLGVSHDAFPEEIKENYKKLALEWHPDRWSLKSEAEKKIAEEKFKEINQAYQVLSDLEKRQEYDWNMFN